MTDNRQGLYLREVDIVERQDGEHLTKAALVVRKREHKARLVGLLQRAHEVGLLRSRHHEEAREVVLVVLYAVLQHLHSINMRGLGMTNSRPTVAFML